MMPGKTCTKHGSSELTLGAYNRSGKYRRSECRWCQMKLEKARRADPKVKEQRRQQAKRRWLRIKAALEAVRSVTQTGDQSVTQTGDRQKSSVTQTGDRQKSSVTQTGDCQSPRQVTDSVTQTGDRPPNRPPPVPKRREIDLSDLPPIPPLPPAPPPDDDGSFIYDSEAYYAHRRAVIARADEIARRRAAAGIQ